MIRNFSGVTAIGAASQPVFGTTATGPSVLTLDPHTLNTKPASQDSVSKIPVTSINGFRVGDRVLVAPKANFVYQGSQDQGTVIGVAAGILTVKGLLITHANGEYVVLGEDAAQVTISPVVAAAPMYLGNASTVSPTDPSTFATINVPEGSPYTSPTVLADSLKTSEYWISGTAGDTYLPYYTQA